MQRPANPSGLAFLVELRGDLDRIRVDLKHGGERRPAPVQRFDAGGVLLRKRPGRLLAGDHPFLQVQNCRLLELERVGLSRLRRGGRRGPTGARREQGHDATRSGIAKERPPVQGWGLRDPGA